MSALLIVWLLVLTVVSIASLVISLRLMSRQPRMPSPPPYQPGYGLMPQGYGAADNPHPIGPTYPQAPNEHPAPMVWRPRTRCAELNITD